MGRVFRADRSGGSHKINRNVEVVCANNNNGATEHVLHRWEKEKGMKEALDIWTNSIKRMVANLHQEEKYMQLLKAF